MSTDRGFYDAVLPVTALNSAVRTTGTVNGTAVDLAVHGNDFREALFVIHAATITDGTHTFKLQDSPDNTTWSDVDSGHVQGGPVSWDNTASNSVAALSYMGSKRYVRLVATTAGATTGGVFGSVAVLAEGSNDPVHRT